MGWVLALQGGVSSLWVRQDRKARRLPLPTPLPWPSKRCACCPQLRLPASDGASSQLPALIAS